MRLGRTIPPVAAPIYIRDIISGLTGLIRGQKELNRFKSELKDYFGAKHCFLLSSGKAALTIILQALHEANPDKDEVLIPAFICYSVPSAIVRAGLKVKLCDSDPETLDFNFDQLEKVFDQSKSTIQNSKFKIQNSKSNPAIQNSKLKIKNSKTLAIISPHLFGIRADIEKTREIVKDSDVTIIEDAAQVMGGDLDGKKLGTFGDVSFFSLGRGKAFSTVEGGIILTDRDDLAENINKQIIAIFGYTSIEKIVLIIKAVILNIFMHPILFWIPKLMPFLKLGQTIYDTDFKIKKMSCFQAGLAKNWQKRVKQFQKKRSECTRFWAKIIKNSNFYTYFSMDPISKHSDSIIQHSNPPSTIQNSQFKIQNFSSSSNPLLRFPVRVDSHTLWEKILKQSKQRGLGIMFTYPDSVNGIKDLKNEFKDQNYPGAKELARNLITLPTHSFVSQKDIKKISLLISKLTL